MSRRRATGCRPWSNRPHPGVSRAKERSAIVTQATSRGVRDGPSPGQQNEGKAKSPTGDAGRPTRGPAECALEWRKPSRARSVRRRHPTPTGHRHRQWARVYGYGYAVAFRAEHATQTLRQTMGWPTERRQGAGDARDAGVRGSRLGAGPSPAAVERLSQGRQRRPQAEDGAVPRSAPSGGP